MPLHVSTICAHNQEVKIVLQSLWYHHKETSEWSKITRIQFYKYEQIVVKFMYEFLGCDYCVLLTINMLCRYDVLLTVHLSIFISVINQLDAQNFCFTISLFHASTCFEQMCSSSGGQNCITQPLVSSHLYQRLFNAILTS